MYHSIDFFYIDPLTNENGSKKNTWEDWGLVGSSRPVIAPAKPITNLIKVTGMSGFYNASEILTGYPVYESRTGSLEFIVLNDFNRPDAKRWIDVYNEVVAYLHGQELCCVLEDEPEYYYIGIFSVNEFASGEHNSTITIDYELQPYKYNRLMSDSDWIWDTFNFQTGVIPSNMFRDLHVTTSTPIEPTEIFSGKVGQQPVVPEIVISSWTANDIDNSKLTLSAHIYDYRGKVKEVEAEFYRRDMYKDPLDHTKGYYDTWTEPLFVLYDDCQKFAATTNDGDITFSIRFREGRL